MITENRNLYSGTPVWQEGRQPEIPYRPLTKNTSTDILIIGAGISGAMMAEALSGHGYDITIVDRRPPLTGSTAATTCLIQYEIDEPLLKLSAKLGGKKACAAWRRSKLGVESLAVKIRELGINCDYERRNSLYIAGNSLNAGQLKEECKARNVIGLAGEYLTRQELKARFGVHASAGLVSWDNVACNPVLMAGGFLNEAVRRGAKLYSPVEIQSLKRAGGGFRLGTSDGITIAAGIVIYLTGYEIPKEVPHRKHTIHSTWALSTKPVQEMPDDFPFLWEAATPYFYGRTTAGGRMIFGGEDEEFSDSAKRDALLPQKTEKLTRKLQKLLPDYRFEIDHTWAGSFGSSTTGLPSMGRVPGYKNLYAVMAYGGNGITFSRIAAEIISGEITGDHDPDAGLFAFSRQ